VAPLGHEPALQAEWPDGRLAGPRWPALLTTREPLPVVDPAFALQQIPDAHWVRGGSPATLARAAAVHVVPRLELTGVPWQLHSFVPDPQAYRTLAPLVPELAAAFLAELRQSAPALTGHQAPSGGNLGDQLLVQLVLVGKASLLVSCARPRSLPAGGHDLAPWPGGRAPVPDDRRAPSRAYRKLVEGFAWLGAAPAAGERCVDLGGAPGGWAWTALVRGASVVAIDRSPLAPPAAGHPGLHAIIGDAFAYRPPQPVDWLLCDVICRPERTIELAETWMRQGLCRRLVATLKFTGTGDYGVIERARQRLGAVGWSFVRMKHLANHHNEVAVLARRD
jgi:23S rRNA (cytidine2498-2'-O)-methyltransferase